MAKRPTRPQSKRTVSLPAGESTVGSLPGEEPYIDPRVPQGALTTADAFKAGQEARRAQNKLPKVDSPVAGGPAPSIPRLDQAPSQVGMTMSQHADAAKRSQAPAMQGPVEGGSFVEPPSGAPAGEPHLNLLPMDVLPNAAKDDPEFREGNGSMFAANQPHLARKYGVIRGNQPIPPQQLVPDSGSRYRPETRQAIEKIAELQAQQTSKKMPEGGPTEKVSDAGKAAATVGNLPGDDEEKPLSKEEQKALEQTLSRMDEFQFDAWRQAMMKDILNNPEQKEIIEARLEPMDVGDLVTEGYLIQKVPVIPNKFEISFKTTDGETDLALKRLIMEDTNSLGEITERYYLDRFAFMSATASLYAINTKVVPEHRDSKGDFDDDLFRKKFNFVLKQPLHMLASIGLNALWFEQRVRALFKAEKLGNG